MFQPSFDLVAQPQVDQGHHSQPNDGIGHHQDRHDTAVADHVPVEVLQMLYDRIKHFAFLLFLNGMSQN